MSKTETPSIRFRGFGDAWEQRKLGELCNITTGKLDANAMVSDGQYDFYTSGIDVFKINVAAFEGPAITIAGNGASVGYMHLADGKFNAYQRTYVLTDFLADRQFLNVAIGNELPNKIQEEVRGSGIPYIVLNMLTDLAIPFPSHEEQYAIGVYFQQLDNLITLHQRKFEKLTNVKKSMLEKMFPQNGSCYPTVRFKGFTDPWEQRKLEDYLTVSTEKNTVNIYGRFDVLSVSGDYGIVNQIEFQGRSFAGASVSNYGVVQTGDVVYTKSPLNSNPYGIIKTNKGKPGIVSTLYAIYHPKENAFSDFIQVYFEQHARMNNYMHPLVNKGAKNDMKVSAENALKGPVCFPSRVEQESISAFFSVLDHLITLHRRELEKLQSIKKSLLEKMFV